MSKTYQTPKGTIRGHQPQTKHMINLKRGLPLGIVGVRNEEGFHTHQHANFKLKVPRTGKLEYEEMLCDNFPV